MIIFNYYNITDLYSNFFHTWSIIDNGQQCIVDVYQKRIVFFLDNDGNRITICINYYCLIVC